MPVSRQKYREEFDHFHTYLRRNGLKRTYQKDLILKVFLSTEGHLSVPDIYALVKKRDLGVGSVTVFRTMKSLVACGLASEIVLADGITRFEHAFKHPPHHHIVCLKCLKIIEYCWPAIDDLQEELSREYRFRPLQHGFQTYGTCEDCRAGRRAIQWTLASLEHLFERDALKMVLFVSQKLRDFLRLAAECSQNAESRRYLENVALYEEKRFCELSGMLSELLKSIRDLDATPVFLHFNVRELEGMIPDVASAASPEGWKHDAAAARSMVMEVKQKIGRYFILFASRFPESRGKTILTEFGRQEDENVVRGEDNLQSAVPGA